MLISSPILIVLAPQSFFPPPRSCALHHAARQGDLEMLQVLLQGDYQRALNLQNHVGNTPLHVAFEGNINGRNSAVVEHLKVLGQSGPFNTSSHAAGPRHLEKQKEHRATIHTSLPPPPLFFHSPTNLLCQCCASSMHRGL